MQKMIIYLHAQDSSWITVNEFGQLTQIKMHDDLMQLKSSAEETDIIVIVPAEDVLLTETKLPKLSRERLLQALPFALEEELITDITELHFAIGDYQKENIIPIAIVAKQKMDDWLTRLKEAELSPSLLTPASLAIDYLENSWNICSEDHISIVRTGKYSGFGCDQNNLEMLLELKLSEHPELSKAHFTQTTLSEQGLLENFAKKMATLPTINLLQGAYPPKRKTSQIKKIWQMAGYLAAAWFAVLIFSHLISFIILQYRVSHIEHEINAIYYQHFPQATAVVSPKERMQTKIKNILLQADSNLFLVLLADAGKSLKQASSIQLQHLDYRNKQLSLEISSNSFDNVDAFSHDLTQQGLSVKQQNATTAGDRVKATLLISRGKS